MEGTDDELPRAAVRPVPATRSVPAVPAAGIPATAVPVPVPAAATAVPSGLFAAGHRLRRIGLRVRLWLLRGRGRGLGVLGCRVVGMVVRVGFVVRGVRGAFG